MSKAIRTILSFVIGLLLFSAMTMAQAGGNNAEKDTNKEHHSRLAKVAFWRHHKGADENAKRAQATPAPSKQAEGKRTQVKPAVAKQAAGKKAPAENKTKPRQKAQDAKTTSVLKQ
jgi:hypothetical protein